jgi:hypothetical protein
MRNLFSQVKTVQNIFELGYFRPASVQRNFQWDTERAERLLFEIQNQAQLAVEADTAAESSSEADLLATDATDQDDIDETASPSLAPVLEAPDDGERADFYIGELVLHESQSNNFDIYDGLQRLTCLTILAAVLRDLIQDVELKARLQACISDGQRFRLAHSSFGRALRELVQNTGMARVQRKRSSRPVDEVGQRIFDVQVSFARILGRYKELELNRLANQFLDRVGATVLTTGNPVLARHIFVAKNLYGLPLSRDEVFKGQILALADDSAEAKAMESEWNKVRDKVGVRDRRNGGDEAQTSEMERFLMAFDAIWRKKPQGADALGSLVDHLSKENRAGRDQFMGAMRRYADAWVKLDDYLSQPIGSDDQIRNHVWRLSFFKWKEWIPLALHWTERFTSLSSQKGMHSKTLLRFAMLARRCMAITLYEFSSKQRQEMFARAVGLATRSKPEEPFGMSTEANSKPLEFSKRVRADVKNALVQPIEDYEVRRSLLLWYEATLWGDKVPGHIKGGSVEHLLPNNPAPGSRWMVDFSDPDNRYWSHGSLGNMVLVDFKLQDPLGNNDFGVKRPILVADGQFSKYRCAGEIEHHSTNLWTATDIEMRTARMGAHAWKELQLRDPTP